MIDAQNMATTEVSILDFVLKQMIHTVNGVKRNVLSSQRSDLHQLMMFMTSLLSKCTLMGICLFGHLFKQLKSACHI